MILFASLILLSWTAISCYSSSTYTLPDHFDELLFTQKIKRFKRLSSTFNQYIVIH